MSTEWSDQKGTFEVIDVRKSAGNFLPMLLQKAGDVAVGEGLCVVQNFEPIPLYSALRDLGFEHETDKVAEDEYRVYFCRRAEQTRSAPAGADMPLKPTAMVNFQQIDPGLADIVVNFWQRIWEPENPAFDMKTRLLLSLANAVGGGRFRQATRELVKAYASGVTVAELDELFSLLVWNQGIGHFASQIGPSPLFGAYRLIKKREGKGHAREHILAGLVAEFGEQNPDVAVAGRKQT